MAYLFRRSVAGSPSVKICTVETLSNCTLPLSNAICMLCLCVFIAYLNETAKQTRAY